MFIIAFAKSRYFSITPNVGDLAKLVSDSGETKGNGELVGNGDLVGDDDLDVKIAKSVSCDKNKEIESPSVSDELNNDKDDDGKNYIFQNNLSHLQLVSTCPKERTYFSYLQSMS